MRCRFYFEELSTLVEDTETRLRCCINQSAQALGEKESNKEGRKKGC